MRFFKCLDLRFSDRRKENEYMSIKRQNIRADFQITMIVLFVVVLTVVPERFARKDIEGGVIAVITIGVLIVLYIFRCLFRKTTRYITVLVLLSYNVYRLILLNSDYEEIVRANLFFGGYTYAALQMILISRIPYTIYRIIAVIITYLLRFGILIFLIDKEALQAGSLIRGFAVDLFIVYYFHSEEKANRRVFRNFDEKRDELLQFKEFLADSLPLGITVVDCMSLKPLFSNAAFLSLFNNCPLSIEVASTASSLEKQQIKVTLEESETCLNLLYADETTIRDIGRGQPDVEPSGLNRNLTRLEEVLKKLLKDSFLVDKALSLTALYKGKTCPRSFDVILKRIKWNGNDAIAIVLNDITYQEKLMYWKMANANKDKIIATVSHELRTPLNGIIGLLDMTEKKVQHCDALDYISLCKDNAHLLLSLVNSLLDMHQISSGKLKLNISKINIRKCLQSVIQLFQFQTNKKGISLALSISEDVPIHINTDENRLKQILINLIGNAIKFTSEGGVRVTVRDNIVESCYLWICVTDTGMGIQEGDKNKLFQMFGKLEDGESVNTSGVGLGLTISNALAVMLSGKKEEREIQVTSQYGKGSTFSLNILKDLKCEGNIDLSSPRKTSESIEHKIMITTESEEQQPISLKINDLYAHHTSEFEELRKCHSRVSEEISDISLEMGDLDSKIAKYKTSQMITIPRLNSQSQLQETQSPNKNIETENSNNSQENNGCLIRSQTFLRSSSRETKRTSKKKSIFAPSENNVTEDRIVFIVDDNPFNLLVAENLVKETGHRVKTASGGHEAIKKMEEFTKEGFDIKAILMDCQMPVIDGYETTKILIEMMEKGIITKAPILALTANNSKEDIQRCYDSGMVGHLTKPTSKKSLMEAFAKLE